MEESISHMVEGLLHESAPVAVPAHTAATPGERQENPAVLLVV